METFELADHLANGVENIVKGVLRATLKDPHESAFMKVRSHVRSLRIQTSM